MAIQKIIDPVDPALIRAELTPERLLRPTNKGGNLIYVFAASECPNAMREVGRLREESFRQAGGGTGLECDIDRFDLMDPPCRQLVVVEPGTGMILGGYRFIMGPDILIQPDGSPRIATAHMFGFSDSFIRDYLPYTIELGRSFVRVDYQSSHAGAKAIFALDNLWDGLGALTVIHPEMRYLFGKMTMYPDYDHVCRDRLLQFLHRWFPDPDRLVWPLSPIGPGSDTDFFTSGSFKEDYRKLNHMVRDAGFNIPPLVNSYMSLSPTMRVFGTGINDEFGNVEETGIFITISEIFEEKKERHICTYNPEYTLTATDSKH